jgi:hypothetical protein
MTVAFMVTVMRNRNAFSLKATTTIFAFSLLPFVGGGIFSLL